MSIQGFDEYDSPGELARAVYKYTACGPAVGAHTPAKGWVYDSRELYTLSWDEVDCLSVSSIVEGVDECTDTLVARSAENFWVYVGEVNKQAEAIWMNTHGCETCRTQYMFDEWGNECDWGNTPVWADCPDCLGKGEVI